VTPATLAAAVAFNLVCTGTSFIGTGLDALKKENQSSYTETFRIDLDSERWCSGKCETTDPIYRVSRTKIVLKFEQDEKIGSESFILLNREDGSILDRTKVSGAFMFMNTGKCERAPFSGFPARRF
jgi:hypothetical protein